MLTGNLAAQFKPTFKDFINNTGDNRANKTNYIFESYGNLEKKLYFIYRNPNKNRTITQEFLKFRQKGFAVNYTSLFKQFVTKTK